MTASFVAVRAVREQPFHSIEMVIPTERIESELPLFAAVVPRDYVWSAKPVPELGLRSESAMETQ